MSAPRPWFSFSLGFSDDGPDLDTVRTVLRVGNGWVAHVESAEFTGDFVFDDFECPDDAEHGFPVYVTGWAYDEEHSIDCEFKGAPVRFKLRDARITIH